MYCFANESSQSMRPKHRRVCHPNWPYPQPHIQCRLPPTHRCQRATSIRDCRGRGFSFRPARREISKGIGRLPLRTRRRCHHRCRLEFVLDRQPVDSRLGRLCSCSTCACLRLRSACQTRMTATNAKTQTTARRVRYRVAGEYACISKSLLLDVKTRPTNC